MLMACFGPPTVSVSETRVSLDSIVYEFRRAVSPEAIVANFPTLTLEQVYGAIAFYLSKQSEIDEYLRKSEEAYETARQANHDQLCREKPELWERLMRAKEERSADEWRESLNVLPTWKPPDKPRQNWKK